MADPPRPSPRLNYRPDLDEEPKTNPRIKKERVRTDFKLVGVIVVGISTTFGAYRALAADTASQVDAGVRVIAAEQKAVDARVTTMEKRLDRVDDKLDLLLDAARVPAWKRPKAMDGGEP